MTIAETIPPEKMKAEVAMESISDNREEWLKFREDTLGSSDITTIAGLNTFKSPLELWAEKTGKTKPEFADNPAMLYGRMVEPAIRAMFMMAQPEFEIEANDDSYRSKEFPWATCTPDSFVRLKDDEKTDFDLAGLPQGLCELKHTGYPVGWEEGAPNYAHCQLIWQLGVLGLDWGFVTAVVGGKANDTKTPFFRFENPVFEQLLELAIDFRQKVKEDIPPQAGPGDRNLIDDLVNREEGEVELITVREWVNNYDDAKKKLKGLRADQKRYEALQREAENNIKLAMGKATAGVLGDGRRVTLKEVVKKPYTVHPKPYWLFKIK